MKSKIIVFLLFFFGGLSCLTGLYGFYRLYDQSGKMVHTVGTVTHLKTETRYIRGKKRFKNTARIQYETPRYPTHVSMQLYNPFISKGSEVSLWYDPESTEKVIIPSEEGILWGGACGLGALFLFLGTALVKKPKHKE